MFQILFNILQVIDFQAWVRWTEPVPAIFAKEKITILKEIKRLNIPQSTENLVKSCRWLFKHRHKLRQII